MYVHTYIREQKNPDKTFAFLEDPWEPGGEEGGKGAGWKVGSKLPICLTNRKYFSEPVPDASRTEIV